MVHSTVGEHIPCCGVYGTVFLGGGGLRLAKRVPSPDFEVDVLQRNEVGHMDLLVQQKLKKNVLKFYYFCFIYFGCK